jgi:cell division protein FtsW (lipid II flippase)
MQKLLDHPRLLGLVCATSAVVLGLAYMAAAGAPARYLVVNLAALLLGAMMWRGLGPRAGAWLARSGWPVVGLALLLLATALFGAAVEGAARWVRVGPINVQISLVVLPALIVLYARRRDAIGTIGVGMAALALAVQPDRAMAGVLAAGMASVLLATRDRRSALALMMAAAAFAATLLRPDALPAVPFVDRILYTAFDVHAAAGLAVVAGCLTLVLPGFSRGVEAANQRAAILAFGACWAAVAIAAALGNYPTPLVGYGGSAVLGYLLSAALLPAGRRHGDETASKSSSGRTAADQDMREPVS